MKVAIIGAGISGLTAAYRLSTAHDVTVFEANDYLGGHTNTVDVEVDGERHAIDTGFIVFNDWTYPNFIALLNELNVKSVATSMSFSVRCDAANLEYNGSSLNGLFSQRSNLIRPSFYRMLLDILRFNKEAAKVPGSAVSEEATVGEYLMRNNYSREFAEHYLLPMGSAIWSCPVGTFESFPIQFIVEFYKNHGLLSVRNRPVWRVIEGGSRSYVTQMVKRFHDRICLSTPIEKVERVTDGVVVTAKNRPPETFDHVIFACHSDQCLRMLVNPTAVEQSVLSEFPYERNIAVLHTDESVLPKKRRAWAAWNYLLNKRTSSKDVHPATVTYQMNILQHLKSRHSFNVTLNSDHNISPAKVLRRFEYSHPVFTVRRAAAHARHSELINTNRTSYCGAYWGNGFHEDGVVSAIRVCDALMPREAVS
jgi:predicted NAD/FAD-binding protein